MVHIYDILKNTEINPKDDTNNIIGLLKKSVTYHDGLYAVHTNLLENIESAFRGREFQLFHDITTATTFEALINKRTKKVDYEFKDLFLFLELLITALKIMRKSNHVVDETMQVIDKIESIAKVILNSTNHSLLIDKKTKFAIIVEDNKSTAEAIECTDNEELALELISYNRVSLKGNIEGKRKVLNLIANHIEPLLEQENLKTSFYANLLKDAGFVLNSFNIRHNNLTGTKKKDFLVDMTEEELENWYDEIYTTLLMVIIASKQIETHEKLLPLKQQTKAKQG